MSEKLSGHDRAKLIDQLVYSFDKMDYFGKVTTKHALGAPKINRKTGQPFKTFREVIECAEDHTLLILKDDFEGNGELLELPA
jgi:hypothetical protein